jgi:hypothetical protein
MKNIILAICEGPHDVAFLYRLFKYEDFQSYRKKIGEFPKPINSLILNAVKSGNYENMKLAEIGLKPVPREILFKEDTMILLYAVGGDGKRDSRKELINNILIFRPDDEDAYDAGKGLNYSIIYFFDADEKGVKRRVEEIGNEVEEIFNVENVNLSNAGIPVDIKGYQVGCYIFSHDSHRGKLEDIMVPLMERDNEEIFQKAGEFLELKDEERFKKLKIGKSGGGKIEETRSGEKQVFDEKKSKICIAGQLQNSGKSNVVIIRECDYINHKKVKECAACREIMAFINSMIPTRNNNY